MKLFWGPNTCAIGIHVLLEEVGLPYTTQKLDLHGGESHRPPFLALNPKGKVPTLVLDDGSALTEFSAIATFLALQDPTRKLLPDDPVAAARVVEVVAYVEGTIHGQGYGRIFVPKLFEPQDLLHSKTGLGSDAVVRQGKEIVGMGFSILDPQLGHQEYAAATGFTIADAALFYVERWAAQRSIALPVNVAAHFASMLRRPSVRKVMEIWGEAAPSD